MAVLETVSSSGSLSGGGAHRLPSDDKGVGRGRGQGHSQGPQLRGVPLAVLPGAGRGARLSRLCHEAGKEVSGVCVCGGGGGGGGRGVCECGLVKSVREYVTTLDDKIQTWWPGY